MTTASSPELRCVRSMREVLVLRFLRVLEEYVVMGCLGGKPPPLSPPGEEPEQPKVDMIVSRGIGGRKESSVPVPTLARAAISKELPSNMSL